MLGHHHTKRLDMSLSRHKNAQWDLKDIFTIAAVMKQANPHFTDF